MSIDVIAEVVIRRSREDVASFVENPDNDPVWIGGITAAQMLTEPPLAKGTKVKRVASFLGRRIEYAPEIVEYEAQSLLAMRAGSPFEMLIRYELEDADDATRMRIRIQGGGSGFFSLAAPLLSIAVRRNIRGDLKRLKKLLESGGDRG